MCRFAMPDVDRFELPQPVLLWFHERDRASAPLLAQRAGRRRPAPGRRAVAELLWLMEPGAFSDDDTFELMGRETVPV